MLKSHSYYFYPSNTFDQIKIDCFLIKNVNLFKFCSSLELKKKRY